MIFYCELLSICNKLIDWKVKSLLLNVIYNIDEFSNLKPEFITFHFEAVSEVSSVINYIHEKGIKVYSYLNIGSVEDNRKYYKKFKDF